jgi:hypothetical protein
LGPHFACIGTKSELYSVSTGPVSFEFVPGFYKTENGLVSLSGNFRVHCQTLKPILRRPESAERVKTIVKPPAAAGLQIGQPNGRQMSSIQPRRLSPSLLP